MNMVQSIFDEKKLILEPITSLIRILLLNYKEEGTKISIGNNAIIPINNTQYQGIIRALNGDKREDLHNIYSPLIKCTEWLPIKDNEINKYLYEKYVKGLDKLMNTYDSNSIIHHTLTHYKSLINNYINTNSIDVTLSNESPLIENLKKIWIKEEIEIIYKILLLIDKSNDKNIINVYINNIESILYYKEKIVYEYVNKSSTIYTNDIQ